MVDFNKLRTKQQKIKAIDPIEIFRRLPKPPGINDLYSSQAEVLQAWFEKRTNRDAVVKLHTGGGKTLVGLLMAQSTLNETGEPVLYLSPTVQLVKQAIEKAKSIGIKAVAYENSKPLHDDFINAKSIMIATYKALFHGKSKFGLRGSASPQRVSAVILDDAHAAFSVVRESFTLEIEAGKERDRYDNITGLFRNTFREIDKIGTFDDILSGSEYSSVLEVPYWAWHEQLDAVREQLRTDSEKYPFVWPLLRDQLHLCHALISCKSFTITPILPLVTAFPTFADAQRRIYMSATISDDTDIISTFDADFESIKNSFASRSLAGVSERMILIPALMPFQFDSLEITKELVQTVSKQNLGAVLLVPSDEAAVKWQEIATVAKGSAVTENLISALQERRISGPIVFANRYDGIDLPGDSCRLLVMSGLPKGTSNYERFRANVLHGGVTITRMLAQRIEQGIGRGARGAGDYCVVFLHGADLEGWIAKDANFRFLTSATKAQLEMGIEISGEVKGKEDLLQTVKRSFSRDAEWIEYHAERLAELTDDNHSDSLRISQAAAERKAVDLWHDGYPEKAIDKLKKLLVEMGESEPQHRGWIEQLAGRIADHWKHPEQAKVFQRQAYAHNRNLIRPETIPPYRPLPIPGTQARAITEQLASYRLRRGFLKNFDEIVAKLHHNSSANQFERALADLAVMIGFSSERHDDNGHGPDVLWLLPEKLGLVIEAKSRKKEKNGLTKDNHGQLLVAAEWFKTHYKDYQCVRVSVLPKNQATKAASAEASCALTYEKLMQLTSDARKLFSHLCESQLTNENILAEYEKILSESPLKAKVFIKNYLLPFEIEK